MITVSIVSHRQFDMVLKTIKSFQAISNNAFFYIVTINIPEEVSEKSLQIIAGSNFKLIINKTPLGFGHNHNNASKETLDRIFIVCNPDIEIRYFDINNFMKKLSHYDIVAPKVVAKNGLDSTYDFRGFPAIHKVLLRQFLRLVNRADVGQKENISKHSWFPGYFILFDINKFNYIGGFDTNFYMYCEDVDLCLRFKKEGYKIFESDDILVKHIGQFSSNKNFRYFYMHLISIIKLNIKMLKGYY